MAVVRPFRALRYQPAAGPLGEVVAPPYDVISPEERAALLARSPYNAVRLELPGEPYSDVAALMADWRARGVLGRPERPGLFAWTQTFTLEGSPRTRRTLLATVKLEPYSARVVRPHERTHAGPKEERLKLFRAVNTHISPVFGLYPDPRGAAWDAAGVTGEPDSVFTSDDGEVENRVWWIDDPRRIAAVQAALADAWILIADGHHRYETSLGYRDELRAAHGDADGPWDDVLMGLSALDDPGLVVLPTHRVLARWPDNAGGRLEAAPMPDLTALRAALAAAPEDVPTFGLVRPDGFSTLTLRTPAGDTPGARLDVAVLEREVLVPDLGADQAALAHDGVLTYVKDAQQAADLVATGQAAAAVLLRPIPKAAVAAVSEAGETMPQKSTYFSPKLLTGVAFHPLVDA